MFTPVAAIILQPRRLRGCQRSQHRHRGWALNVEEMGQRGKSEGAFRPIIEGLPLLADRQCKLGECSGVPGDRMGSAFLTFVPPSPRHHPGESQVAPGVLAQHRGL
jgi:hypothetical protein